MRRPVVVVDGGGVTADLPPLRATLAALGHDVVVLPVSQACSALPAGRAGWVLVDAATLDTSAGSALLEAADDAGAVLVGWHGRLDPTVAWRVFRAGAVPWVPSRRLPLPVVGPLEGDVRTAAADALHADLAGHHDEGWHAVHRLGATVEVAQGTATLVQIGAAALERFRGRAGHPVALDVLTSHLTRQVGPLDGRDFAWWWTMTEQMTFLAGGVALPPPDADDAPDALVGAFHAAGAVVRFTARRHWRVATDLLDDVRSGIALAGIPISG